MKINFRLDKKAADFLVMAVVLLSFAGIVIAVAPNPGHSSST